MLLHFYCSRLTLNSKSTISKSFSEGRTHQANYSSTVFEPATNISEFSVPLLLEEWAVLQQKEGSNSLTQTPTLSKDTCEISVHIRGTLQQPQISTSCAFPDDAACTISKVSPNPALLTQDCRLCVSHPATAPCPSLQAASPAAAHSSPYPALSPS